MSKQKIKLYTFKQRSEEWDRIRVGKVGGSEAIGLTTPARMKTLLYRKASEILTGEQEENFVSAIMQEAIDNEPVVTKIYEKKEFVMVLTPGYVTNSDYKHLGLSPDGLVGKDRAIEIKCLLPKGHVEIISSVIVPKDHRPQIAHYFLILPDLKYVHFLSYNGKVKARPYFKIECTREDFEADIFKLKNSYLEYEILLKNILEHF